MGFKQKGFPMHSTASALKQIRQASPIKYAETYPTELMIPKSKIEVSPEEKYKRYNQILKNYRTKINPGDTMRSMYRDSEGEYDYLTEEEFLEAYPSGDEWIQEQQTRGKYHEDKRNPYEKSKFVRTDKEGKTTIPFEEGYRKFVNMDVKKGHGINIENLSTTFSDTEGSPDLTNAIIKLKEDGLIDDSKMRNLLSDAKEYNRPSEGFPMHNSASALKQASPIKFTGIFDAKGNRISIDDALALEESGENVTYTEGDALEKAQQNYDAATTTAEKALWQKEIDEQTRIMEERKASTRRTLSGDTKGDLYTGYSEADKKLQDMINSGEYDKLSDEEKTALEKAAGRTQLSETSRSNPGGWTGEKRVKETANFPTTGQIGQTESKIDELKDLGII